ncbi:30S ribosomal protein S13 [Candidatus Uhrbacteria bacterium RIFCSPHIGHO2_12_FULL_54_23]|uniref:Small ribosomal subunit protein uS13 n=3 Tax=Candidatus Uhriibacteriota TaxID=1752732 RepID=A0A1F7UML1_9BACT|nr:MAG: 30S ribosomal protein S13 [Candidatus Uhrbacteria bacterium RIFCSPHIGHO2_12_FULL_54_23]OGL84534.1 MAG: 30S ribosomal protein S13 [Candidatus Uhrbacteria bacterium RIFCSPLOWO2_01_FULL_55_36]OGL90947.1 MAG: 30S ribosomal protein S13 [Candidatus Uhrbacteria bacterium RIFCSPLOWO2_02_FULL_54_37]
MARIAGVTLPPQKRIDIGLSYIYGIGRPLAVKILAATQVDPSVRVKDLPESDVGRLREYIEKQYKVEGDLKREVMLNIKRLKEIGSYRGTRHTKNLPSRGQRTKTNSRTVRGNVRRTMGSGKKPTSQKT